MANQSYWSIEPELLGQAAGLRPRLWIGVGAEISREEVKRWILEKELALTGESVQTLEQMAARLLGVTPDRILKDTARQEALRLLLARASVRARLPEIRRLKRQRPFWRRLDRALQQGRMSFAHPAEAQVLSERLQSVGHFSALKGEIEFVSALYEAWLTASDLWDGPRLLAEAADRLPATWPSDVHLPETILYLGAYGLEARPKFFFEFTPQALRGRDPTGAEFRGKTRLAVGALAHPPRWGGTDRRTLCPRSGAAPVGGGPYFG